MTEETKRDVFEDAVFQAGKSLYTLHDTDYAKGILGGLSNRYDAALPDDLPVIPKDVSEWLTWCKRTHRSLKDALDGETRVSEDVFARAWLLGIWRVEETGEIVKLEAEK